MGWKSQTQTFVISRSPVQVGSPAPFEINKLRIFMGGLTGPGCAWVADWTIVEPVDGGPKQCRRPRLRATIRCRARRASRGADSKQGLDGPAVVHGSISLDDSLELGLKIEDQPGVDAAFKDILQQLGDVRASWGYATA
jgi:hypothetical protein